MKDRRKYYGRDFSGLAAQMAQFNADREDKFSRGPDKDQRLPIPHTMVGGDIPGNDEL